jgi:hypothetical protein
VALAGDRPGVLTAGHIGRVVGARATIDGTDAGRVVYSSHRAKYTYPQTCLDVAAIELHDQNLVAPAGAAIGQAVQMGLLHALNRSGVGGTDGFPFRGLLPSFAVDEAGMWRDAGLVCPAISEGGDSGSMVVDDAGRIVGQVVGGDMPSYTVFQDAQELLADASSSLRTA